MVVVTQAATEADLESQFATGDDGVLAAAYTAHGALVYSYCRRMLDSSHAVDATRDVFVAAWRSRERYRPGAGALAGWLLGIACFEVIDILRSDAPQSTLPADQVQPSDPEAAESDATRVAERMLVAQATASLPERARQTVQLAVLEDLTQAQIAERCDLPMSIVESDLRLGLERMRRHLEGLDNAVYQ